MKKLYIIGSGGFSKEVIWLVNRINSINNEWQIVGLLDDNTLYHDTVVYGQKVLGPIELINSVDETVYCVCAIGNSKIRQQVIEKISNRHVKFATLIDPSVLYSETVRIGEGSIICAGTILTVDIKIGKHTIINLDCTIGHDAILEDFVTIYPSVNVSGNVFVGRNTELGTGTQIIQGIQIASSSITGAGTVLTRNVKNPSLVVGIPGIVKKEFL